MIKKEYRVSKKRMTSLEGSTFHYYIIQKRRFKHIGIDIDFFWRDVLNTFNPNYPYEFNTEKEANEFILDELIGRAKYRETKINNILK